jgi:hypothetical protein
MASSKVIKIQGMCPKPERCDASSTGTSSDWRQRSGLIANAGAAGTAGVLEEVAEAGSSDAVVPRLGPSSAMVSLPSSTSAYLDEDGYVFPCDREVDLVISDRCRLGQPTEGPIPCISSGQSISLLSISPSII